MREWLARLIYPEAFRNEMAYRRLKAEMADAYYWLGAYPDAADALRWALDNDLNRNRAIGEKAIGKLPSDISLFREHLATRHTETKP